jgi:iron(III) transport system substrate-binding protein
MARRIFDAALALVVTALVVAAGARPALAQKQTVVVYTAIENEQITDYMKAITKALPNVDVKLLRLSTGDISARFMAEKDNMQADVIWGVGATNILIFKNAGMLEPYAPKGLDKIVPLFRDKDNPPAWVGMDIYMSAFCFNTEVGKKHSLPAPTSWADLTKPVYKGHVVMPNPASSGTGYLSVASILQRMGEAEGWKYLDALHQNIAEYTKSGSKPCKDAAAGERAVGVSFEYVAFEMKKKGAPVEMVLPKEGAGYEMEANALTKKGAKNPAAKQFLDWADSEEAMRLYAQYFAAVGVAGIPGPEGLPKDITKVVYPNDFDWSAKNRDRILTEWQKRYAK